MAEGIELATAYVNIVSSARGLGDSITGELSDAGRTAEAEGKKSGSRFAGAFGKGLAIAGGLAAVGGVATKALYGVGAAFDDVADTIRVGTGATGDNLDSLIASAKLVGTSVPTDFGKAGSTVADLNTRLGLSGKTLEKVASQYIQAGNILGEDVDIAGTTAAFSAFGIQGDKVSDAMDTLFRVSQATGVGMNELASNAGSAAPAMRALGFTFEDTTALVGSLDKAGLNSTAVMASMSKGLVKLAKDGQSPQEAFRDVTGEIEALVQSGDKAAAIDLASGVFGTKAAVQFVGAVESGTLAFDDLMGATGATGDTILGLGEETADLAESFALFKNRGLLELEPLGTKVFGALSAGMAKLADSVAPTADAIRGVYNILAKGDFTGAFAGFEEDSKFVDVLFSMREKAVGFGQSVGSAVASGMDKARPVLQKGADAAMSGVRTAIDSARPYAEKAFAALGPAMDKARPALQKAGSSAMDLLGKSFEKLQPILADVFAEIGPVIKDVLKAIGPVIKQLAPIFAQLLPLMNPFMLVFKQLLPILPQLAQLVGQIATAVGGALVTAMNAILPVLPDIALLIGQVVVVLADGLAQAIVAIVPLVTTLAGVLVALLPSFVDLVTALLPPLLSLFEALIPLITGVIAVVVPLVSQFVEFLIPAIEALLPVVTVVFDAISNIISTVMGVVEGIISTVTGLISGNWSKVWEGIQKVFTTVWDGIKKHVEVIINAISTVISTVSEAIKTAAATVWAAISAVILTPIEAVKTALSTVATAIADALGAAWEGIKTAAKAAWDLIKGYIVDPLQAAYDWVTTVFSTVGTFFADLWQGIVDTAGEILGGIGTAVGDAFGGIVDAIKWPINQVIQAVNWVIDQLNKISFTLPDWLPDFLGGGKTFGINIAHIPELADGGVIDPVAGGRLVIAGEARQREIVTPEPLMKSIIRGELEAAGGAGGGPLIGTVNMQPGQSAWDLARDLDRQMAFAGGR